MNTEYSLSNKELADAISYANCRANDLGMGVINVTQDAFRLHLNELLAIQRRRADLPTNEFNEVTTK